MNSYIRDFKPMLSQDFDNRVLLISSEPERARRLSETLADLGYDVVPKALMGADVQCLIFESEPDIIIFDLERTTPSLLYQIERTNQNTPKPIMIFTQDRRPDNIRSAARAGVSAYVVDEFKPERLRPIMDAAIARFNAAHDRLKIERQLQDANRQLEEARQKAEMASEAKSRFLANMSHEIRTPLNIILGVSHLLRERDLQQDVLEDIDKVADAGKLLLSLINDVLDLSRIESDRVELESLPFDLCTVIHRITGLLAIKAREKGLKLHVNFLQKPSTALLGDPLRVGQILMNLGNNAIKFTERGEVSFTISCQHQEESASWRVMVEVRDTGIGIDRKKQEDLFEPFVQTDNSHYRRYGGSGLGLSISRRLARLMGGELSVQSEVGTGSQFNFQAPFYETSEQVVSEYQTLEDPNARQRLAGAHLLLAEDNDLNRKLAATLLSNKGIQVTSVSNGEEALDMVSKQNFDGILLDIEMPRMGGYETARRIRALPGFELLPIIAMTANVYESDRRMALDAGMNDHIAKPIDPGRLYATLAHWIGMPEQVFQPVEKDELPTESIAYEMLRGIDRKAGLKVCNGSESFYLELLENFSRDPSNHLSTLRNHIRSGNFEELRFAAHTLKGVAGNIGARDLFESARQLETLAIQKQDSSVMEPTLHTLEAQFTQVKEGIMAFLASPEALS